MSTNANVFNSRVTSEALEAKFRQVFPAQAGAELIQDLYASGVIQPVIDFSSVAEGSFLPANLQTAWDFSTGAIQIATSTYQNVITNTGFWLVDLLHTGYDQVAGAQPALIQIFDGSTGKTVWARSEITTATTIVGSVVENKFVVFLRAGDVLRARAQFTGGDKLDIWYRQIADVNGNLVNPLGFTFS